jgi:clan AA aspartic protease (TIGR02281 family)
MAITCPACGEENRDGARICELCRALFEPRLGPGITGPAAAPVVASPASEQSHAPTPPVASRPASEHPVLFIPAAPPQRGRAAVVAAGIGGAAAALLVVAAVKLTAHPSPPASIAPVPAPVAPERIYVPVTVIVAGPSPAAQTAANRPPSAVVADTRPALRTPDPPPRAAEKTEDRPNRIIVPYRGHDGRSQRILVPVTVNGAATVTMAVDTGAPGTIISYGLANHLGILREDDGKLLIRARGIGGSAPAVLVVLDSLTLGDAKEQFVPATVTESLSDSFEGLLGMDFISTFALKIDTAQRVLILTKPRPSLELPAGHGEHWWRALFREFADQRKRWETFRDLVDRNLST